ncbi:SGPL1, partial [Cordylochernes scorpioides]
VTSGGTESIFMACKAFRDYAYHVKGITKPEMVIPVSAHAAFDKAGQLLKIRVRHAPMVKATMQADLQAMRRAINKNTVMLVGSCPQFPHGIMDSISDIAKLGERYDIPVHVDSCLGGLLLPFMAEAGHPIPPFDFTLPGVTSISCDTHKYGFTPKGTSVVVYRDVKYRHYQFSVQPDWPGGIYCTPTLAGSRAGGTIAATWATLLYMGRQGYLESCRKIIASTRILVKGLRKIEGLIVYGDPQLSVVALGSNHFDIYRLCDALSAKGWNINMIQKPKGFHICVTLQHTAPGVIDDLLRDMRDCTAEIMKHPSQPATGN